MTAGAAFAAYARAFATEMLPNTLFSDRSVLFVGRLLVMLCVDIAYAAQSSYVALSPLDDILSATPWTYWGRACRATLLMLPRTLLARAHAAAERSFMVLSINVPLAPFSESIA